MKAAATAAEAAGVTVEGEAGVLGGDAVRRRLHHRGDSGAAATRTVSLGVRQDGDGRTVAVLEAAEGGAAEPGLSSV